MSQIEIKIIIDINTKELWTIEELSAYSSFEITYLRKKCSEREIPYYNPHNCKKPIFKRVEMIEWLSAEKVKTRTEILQEQKSLRA